MNKPQSNYINLTTLLGEMLRIEGSKGVVIEPRRGRCGVCGRSVIADLHIAHRFVDYIPVEYTVMCFNCLERQYNEVFVRDSIEDYFSIEFPPKNIKRAKMDVERSELRRKFTPRRRLEFINLEMKSTIIIHPECWKKLKELYKATKKITNNPFKVEKFLFLSECFYSKYVLGRELGLKLPDLSRTEIVSLGAFYTALWKQPEYVMVVAEDYDLEGFYKILPKILGYGIFPFETIFIRPSEVFRLAYWGINRTGIYLETLFWTSRVLRKFLILEGENMKSLVVATFFRELTRLQKKNYTSGLPFKIFLESFLKEISLGHTLNRTQIYNCFKRLDWIKEFRKSFLEEYRDAVGLKELRRDEVEKVFLQENN